MRSRWRLIFAMLLCCAPSLRAQFNATILFGHKIPVYTWNGTGSALEFAAHSLDTNQDAQGVLVILGRDSKSVWYLRYHYPDDAGDRGAVLMLQNIDTMGKIHSYPSAPDLPTDTTFYDAFIHMFTSVFRKQYIQQLTPVETWACARDYQWVAQVNSSVLHHCFQWNLDVNDDPTDGSCVFYFNWTATTLAFQQTREVPAYDCVLTIPFDWTYRLVDEFHGGYVAHRGDTLFFSQSVAMGLLPLEKVEYTPPDDPRNVAVRRYNDSLRKENPMLVTHIDSTVKRNDVWLMYYYPKPDVTSHMNLDKLDIAGESFLMYTTVLPPKRQGEFRKVLASLKWR